MTAELVALAGGTRDLADKIPPPADTPMWMAVEALDEALLRLRVPLTRQRDDT